MNTGEILIYQNQEGNIKIDVRLEEETVWLTQSQICELFQKSKTTINEPAPQSLPTLRHKLKLFFRLK